MREKPLGDFQPADVTDREFRHWPVAAEKQSRRTEALQQMRGVGSELRFCPASVIGFGG